MNQRDHWKKRWDSFTLSPLPLAPQEELYMQPEMPSYGTEREVSKNHVKSVLKEFEVNYKWQIQALAILLVHIL